MANSARAISERDGQEFLRRSFACVQARLENELKLSHVSVTHDGVMGAVNERHWIKVLTQYLPDRYQVDSGIVIDSKGHVSEQIDVVVYDRQYTPELLTQEDHRYIPVEAVYAVLEVKPHVDRHYLEYAGNKAATVRGLCRTTVSIHHAGGRFDPKPPFEIVAGILAGRSDWTDGLGDSFRAALSSLDGLRRVDCGCALSAGAFDFFDDDRPTVIQRDAALIWFLFRFLHKLQSLGTVPAIDWTSYLAAFGQE